MGLDRRADWRQEPCKGAEGELMKYLGNIMANVLVGLLMLVLSACAQPESGAGSPCDGGIADEGTCVRIEKIAPFYLATETASVDIVRDLDCDGDPATVGRVDDEPFRAHMAKVGFDNSLRIPDSGEPGRDINLTHYVITYELAHCPAGLFCPANLASLRVGVNLFLATQERLEDVIVELFPIAYKSDCLGSGSGLLALYTATYTFTGLDEFGENVRLSGSTMITLGDFENCA
jgi:hypothetical protein